MSRVTIHISETSSRHAVPLCRATSRPTSYVPQPDELVWILSRAKAPARVQLGGTGFTVPVSMIEDVRVNRMRAVMTCSACLKKLASMPERLEAAQ